jgi:hypothetical protein
MDLILSMGTAARDYSKRKEGFRYDGAVIQVINWNKKKIVKEITYKPPSENIGDGLSLQFKGATIYLDKYYVVTNTETLRYNLSSWELEEVHSLPSFNDLHGVLIADGLIYVCNTGLEMIQVFTLDWELVKEINLGSIPVWDRFDKSQDYRRIATTKPHEVHVNHLFEMDGNIWATRGQKQDAINLGYPSERIHFNANSGDEGVVLCHDGIVRDNYVYFTCVNGQLLFADRDNQNKVERIDLNLAKPGSEKLGWIRGLEIVENFAFIGSSKIRGSKFKEYTKWFLPGSLVSMPSSIIQFDLNDRKFLDHYELEKQKGQALFTISKYPE